MTDWVPWLRGLAAKGRKGVVNNIDARCLGRIADQLERLRGENAKLSRYPESSRLTTCSTGEVVMREKLSECPICGRYETPSGFIAWCGRRVLPPASSDRKDGDARDKKCRTAGRAALQDTKP